MLENIDGMTVELNTKIDNLIRYEKLTDEVLNENEICDIMRGRKAWA